MARGRARRPKSEEMSIADQFMTLLGDYRDDISTAIVNEAIDDAEERARWGGLPPGYLKERVNELIARYGKDSVEPPQGSVVPEAPGLFTGKKEGTNLFIAAQEAAKAAYPQATESQINNLVESFATKHKGKAMTAPEMLEALGVIHGEVSVGWGPSTDAPPPGTDSTVKNSDPVATNTPNPVDEVASRMDPPARMGPKHARDIWRRVASNAGLGTTHTEALQRLSVDPEKLGRFFDRLADNLKKSSVESARGFVPQYRALSRGLLTIPWDQPAIVESELQSLYKNVIDKGLNGAWLKEDPQARRAISLAILSSVEQSKDVFTNWEGSAAQEKLSRMKEAVEKTFNNAPPPPNSTPDGQTGEPTGDKTTGSKTGGIPTDDPPDYTTMTKGQFEKLKPDQKKAALKARIAAFADLHGVSPEVAEEEVLRDLFGKEKTQRIYEARRKASEAAKPAKPTGVDAVDGAASQTGETPASPANDGTPDAAGTPDAPDGKPGAAKGPKTPWTKWRPKSAMGALAAELSGWSGIQQMAGGRGAAAKLAGAARFGMGSIPGWMILSTLTGGLTNQVTRGIDAVFGTELNARDADRQTVRMGQDVTALVNSQRADEIRRRRAMEAFTQQPELYQQLQQQATMRSQHRRGLATGDVQIGGDPTAGVFENPEALLSYLGNS